MILGPIKKGILVGYSEVSKAYRIFVSAQGTGTRVERETSGQESQKTGEEDEQHEVVP